MIEGFVKIWEEKKPVLFAMYSETHPESYEELFKNLIKILESESEYDEMPDSERITVIDHGHYQGTLLFIVGSAGYQPDKYWSCYVEYGSCSGCDTFQAVQMYETDEKPNESQTEGYMRLTLHMLQGLKEI